MPRTIAQAEALEAAGIRFDHVVSLEVSDETIEERMSGRRVCEHCGASYHIKAVPPRTEGVCDVCGGKLVTRKDDAPETVKNRLAVYHRETEPLKDFYRERGVLYPVEDMGRGRGHLQGDPRRAEMRVYNDHLKSAHEIELMRRAGKITAAARALAGEMVKPGVTTRRN